MKVGRRYSNTTELLTALVRPSKQWGPNQYQVLALHTFLVAFGALLFGTCGLFLRFYILAKEVLLLTCGPETEF